MASISFYICGAKIACFRQDIFKSFAHLHFLDMPFVNSFIFSLFSFLYLIVLTTSYLVPKTTFATLFGITLTSLITYLKMMKTFLITHSLIHTHPTIVMKVFELHKDLIYYELWNPKFFHESKFNMDGLWSVANWDYSALLIVNKK